MDKRISKAQLCVGLGSGIPGTHLHNGLPVLPESLEDTIHSCLFILLVLFFPRRAHRMIVLYTPPPPSQVRLSVGMSLSVECCRDAVKMDFSVHDKGAEPAHHAQMRITFVHPRSLAKERAPIGIVPAKLSRLFRSQGTQAAMRTMRINKPTWSRVSWHARSLASTRLVLEIGVKLSRIC